MIGQKRSIWPPACCVHGSSTLYRSEGAEKAWEKVLAFLEKHLR